MKSSSNLAWGTECDPDAVKHLNVARSGTRRSHGSEAHFGLYADRVWVHEMNDEMVAVSYAHLEIYETRRGE